MIFFRQRQIWDLLRSVRVGMSPRDIAKALGVHRKTIGVLLNRMERKGCVIGKGETWGRTYRPTRKAPYDGRGRHEAARDNLRRGRAKGLLACAAAKGRAFIPAAKHHLDRVLGRPVSPISDKTSLDVLKDES